MGETDSTIAASLGVSALDAEGLHCPLCGYDLRGLAEPRCPECGYQFVWAELLDKKRNTHPYLFEHHPTRNFWSFIRTLQGGLNPLKFWRTLRPQMTPVPGRLLLYWVACTTMPTMLGLALLGSSDVADRFYPPQALGLRGSLYLRNLRRPPSYIFNGHSIVPMPPWAAVPMPAPPRRPPFADILDSVRKFLPALFITSIAIFSWSIATHLSLLIFQQSMAKAKILPIHVNRCVRYSFDIGVWFAAMWLAAILYVAFVGDRNLSLPLAIATIAIAITPMGRLWAAYWLYLKFDHAFWVVLSSQVITFMTLLTIMLIPQWLR